MKFSAVLFFVLISYVTYSQSFINLYSDNKLTLELKIKVSKTVCEEGGDLTKFQYRIKGNLYPNQKFVTWKINYVDCRGTTMTETNSIIIGGYQALQHYDVESYYIQDELLDKDPDNYLQQAKELKGEPYDIYISDYEVNSREETKVLITQLPSEILGSDTILYGESVDLFFNNGLLGVNSEWVWYKNSCGTNEVGRGEQITDNPTENTTYYLSALGDNLNCVKKVVVVDKRSFSPNSISGLKEVCKDETIDLEVQGGHLGLGARWVWYENSFEGRKLGYGRSVNLKITSKTRVFVRAEGIENITNSTYVDIDLITVPQNPYGIYLSNDLVCEDILNTAKVEDFNTKPVTYYWYKNDMSSYFSSGKTINFSISVPTTLFVVAKNRCGTSNPKSITMYPVSSSKEVRSVKIYRHNKEVSINKIMSNKKYEIIPDGYKFGAGAYWVWKKDNLSYSYNEVLREKIKKVTDYSVYLKGTCNQTIPYKFTIYPKDSKDKTNTEKWTDIYADGERSIQLGFALGIDLTGDEIKGFESYKDLQNNDVVNDVMIRGSGLGIKYQVSYHPIINDIFSLGFFPSIVDYSLFETSNLTERNGDVIVLIDPTKSSQAQYSAKSTIYKFDTEICLGYDWFKLMLKTFHSLNNINESVNQSFYNYALSNGGIKYDFNQLNFNEILGFGCRIGRYKKRHLKNNGKLKKGGGVDLLYTFRRNDAKKYNYKNVFTEWSPGFEMVFWKQNIFKISLWSDIKSANISFNYTFDRFK